MSELTSNQYYGGLNRRFDNRARRLRQLGFAYQCLPDFGAFFVRSRYGKRHTVPAAAVAHASNRAWIDTLRNILR